MKSLLFGLLAILSVTSAFASQNVVLRSSAPVFKEIDRYYQEEFVTFLGGTRLIVSQRAERVSGLGSVYRVLGVRGVETIQSNYRYNAALDINRGGSIYFVSTDSVRGTARVTPRPTRPVVTPRPTRPVVTGSDMYQVCYERPKSRVVQINENQRRRGGNNVAGGIAGIIGGQIIGGLTGNDDLGNAISVIGAGFAAVGAVQVASSREVFYVDNGVDCRQYYDRDPRVYSFYENRKRCTTTRYYTSRWGRTTEYFETSCSGSRGTYVSFQRSSRIWR